MVVLRFVIALMACGGALAFENMNGKYHLTPTPNAPGTFPTEWSEYPGGVEYFEVYHGPIKSVYSEVFWTTLSNDLPKDIVDRFDGKAIAIVGLEMDQVRRTDQGDVSVPITLAYNHHHDTAVVGANAHLEKMKRDMSDPRFANAGRKYIRLDKGMAWVAVEDKPTASGLPSSAMFSDGNGGEYRKTFHALAPPYAQVVESPRSLSGSPMQIDTWNRDMMNITGGQFFPGPYPRHNLAPKSGPDAIYSGILECPLTTRIQKVLQGGSTGFNDTFFPDIFSCAGSAPQQCSHRVTDAETCFAQAKALPGLENATVSSQSVSSDDMPAGCSVSVVRGAGGAIAAKAIFNSNNDSKACCGLGPVEASSGSVSSLLEISLRLDAKAGVATINLTGPANVWFGVGFNATQMADKPYAIIVDGSGNVTERRLGQHEAGSQIANSLTVVSNAVVSGRRSLVLTRALKGKTGQHHTFDPAALTMDLINAVGSGPAFAYHKDKTATTLALWPEGSAPACVCVSPPAPFGQGQGVLKYLPTGEVIGFPNKCDPQPRTDLLAMRNPTCDIRTYVGGLSTCHHGWNLLDADQEIPWQDQPLEYYKKFRIYFQEYNASFHKQIQRSDWGIGADHDHAEYDVMQCPEGTPTENCTQYITGTWQPVPASHPNVHMVLAHFHCHAPTCLRMELWNNDTGALLCRQEPLYGGTGSIDEKRFDEPGYIATPPCMWGSPEHGLEPPPLVSGVTIRVTALTNSTYGHHGEMALPEVSLVQF